MLVGQAELLPGLFREVVIPPEVAAEFDRLVLELPRFSGLVLPSWLRLQPCSAIPEIIKAQAGLDAGESAALALALEIDADAVLVDERRGHEVARRIGLTVIGIFGILLRAKTAGLLPAIKPILEALRTRANFWFSDQLQNQILRSAGEAP